MGGAINSISRACTAKGIYTNRCVPDANFNTCYSVCSSDLCNSDTNLDTKYTTAKPDTSVASSMKGGHIILKTLWGTVVGGGIFLLPRLFVGRV